MHVTELRCVCMRAGVITKMATFSFYHIQLSLLCSFIVSLASPQTTCFSHLVCSFCIKMYSDNFFYGYGCVGRNASSTVPSVLHSNTSTTLLYMSLVTLDTMLHNI